jgi:mono/diheme cytochrome c family protein
LKTKWVLVPALLTVVLAVWGVGAAFSDDEDEAEREGRRLYTGMRPGIAPVNNQQYASECGACHMAYQPGLMPADSWKPLMAKLDDHFGENAELPNLKRQELLDYLVSNSADKVQYTRSARIATSLRHGRALPTRITEIPYIAAKHKEIPDRLIAGNPKVGSLSNCAACHIKAGSGVYNEHSVSIPGYARWED